jgi:hypothetical protein
MMTRRRSRPHPFYRVPLFYVPRPPRTRRGRYVERSDFDELREELRRDRDRSFEETCR